MFSRQISICSALVVAICIGFGLSSGETAFDEVAY
jgi:hypothetical protein